MLLVYNVIKGVVKKMDNKNIFAKNLKFYMKLQGKTRKKVCEDLGFSYYTFSDWVNGKKYPRMDKVEILAQYFGVLKSDLIEDKNNIGSKIKELRINKNKAIHEMADELNIDPITLEQYENGTKKIPFEFMQKLADYFNVDFSNNANFSYFKETNQSDLKTSLHIIEMTKRWNDEVGEANFTDEEVTKLIEYAKFLISQREK